MTDIRHEIELVTPGLNFLEGHGEGAKTVIEQTKKTLHQAADRIKALEESLAKYSCGCPYPCALYDAEKAKEDEMPHMMCGWWAKSVLEELK